MTPHVMKMSILQSAVYRTHQEATLRVQRKSMMLILRYCCRGCQRAEEIATVWINERPC